MIGPSLDQLEPSGATDGQVPGFVNASGLWVPRDTVHSVVAGTNVTVDNTDPFNPVISASGGGGGTGSLTVQDENGTVATGVTQIDFQGAGVTATAGTGEVVVTIPGGGGGGGSVESYDAAVSAALTGVVHRWKFDDASGATVADSVGSLPLTLSGTYTRHVASATGYGTTFASGATAVSSGLGSIPTGSASRCVIFLVRTTSTVRQTLGIYGATSTRQQFDMEFNYDAQGRTYLQCWGDDHILDKGGFSVEIPFSGGAGYHLWAYGYKSSAQATYLYHNGAMQDFIMGGALGTATTGNFQIGSTLVGDVDDVIVLNNWPGKRALDRLLYAAAGLVFS
jgi:hypothetical protein